MSCLATTCPLTFSQNTGRAYSRRAQDKNNVLRLNPSPWNQAACNASTLSSTPRNSKPSYPGWISSVRRTGRFALTLHIARLRIFFWQMWLFVPNSNPESRSNLLSLSSDRYLGGLFGSFIFRVCNFIGLIVTLLWKLQFQTQSACWNWGLKQLTKRYIYWFGVFQENSPIHFPPR